MKASSRAATTSPSRSSISSKHAYEDFGELTGRHYGLISQVQDRRRRHRLRLARLAPPRTSRPRSTTCARPRNAKVGSIHVNVIRPFPEAASSKPLRGKKNVIILERTDEALAGDNPLGRDIRTALCKAQSQGTATGCPHITPDEMPRIFRGSYGLGSRDFRPEHTLGAYEFATGQPRPQRRQDRRRRRQLLRPRHRSSLRGDQRRHAVAAAGGRDRRPLPLHRRLGRDHHRQEPRRHHRRPQRSALRARRSDRRRTAIPRKSSTSAPTRSTARRRRARRPTTSWSRPRTASASTATCAT